MATKVSSACSSVGVGRARRSRAASHTPRSASAAPMGVVSDVGSVGVEQIAADDALAQADRASLVDQRDQPGLRRRQRQRVVGRVPAPVGVVQVAIFRRRQRIERRQRDPRAGRRARRRVQRPQLQERALRRSRPIPARPRRGSRRAPAPRPRCARARRFQSTPACPLAPRPWAVGTRRIERRRSAGLAREEHVDQHGEAEVVASRSVLGEIGDDRR